VLQEKTTQNKRKKDAENVKIYADVLLFSRLIGMVPRRLRAGVVQSTMQQNIRPLWFDRTQAVQVTNYARHQSDTDVAA